MELSRRRRVLPWAPDRPDDSLPPPLERWCGSDDADTERVRLLPATLPPGPDSETSDDRRPASLASAAAMSSPMPLSEPRLLFDARREPPDEPRSLERRRVPLPPLPLAVLGPLGCDESPPAPPLDPRWLPPTLAVCRTPGISCTLLRLTALSRRRLGLVAATLATPLALVPLPRLLRLALARLVPLAALPLRLPRPTTLSWLAL